MKGNVTVILRGYTYDQVKSVCNVLVESEKVSNVEITLNTKNALEIIKKITHDFKDKLSIGAGTVVTFDELKSVISCGVKFVLSPTGYTKEMIDFCHQNNVEAIPAALTPSEILDQIQKGADIVKVFPANEFSSKYARKVCEPLGKLPLMAVGGINADNVKAHFDGGYQYVGTAGGIFNKKDILEMNEKEMKKSLENFESKI
ncbi:bifunctional 4-hydroxy-2-oxoglutarate aldolase/2-dehydro-3-deoxy-phosphogluconate aldolase [Faecalicoccus pleomorphus]|uniref:bifunctional 4-hydroxy-2-oxoglutarate aldolase/2-dehydro-3-deoxy-phosphogluconate aldolase n=1 Tax=Faecalicoccus pleomorphus TaxID=1323 RepID=UPI0022DEF446|nr:bifunctional 4-hydroxy-2-oxoglutarate aldolase/2-dehydro-3-deoxy-phosphogluconate aldolase [Faecalicoccus pleomorphus]